MLGNLVFLVFGAMGSFQFLELNNKLTEVEDLEETSARFLSLSATGEIYETNQFLQQNTLSTLVVVSDTSNQVSGPDVAGTTSAVVSIYETSSPIPGANWIWDAAAVSNSNISQTIIITKDFFLKTPPTKGLLIVYTDDQFTLKVNCRQVTSCQGTSTPTVPINCDVSSYLGLGNNHLEFTVTNNGYAKTTPQINPGGLLYQLTVTYPPLAPIPNPANPPLVNVSFASFVVVSDTTNLVSGPDVVGTVNAFITTPIGNSPIPGASWIWDAASVSSSITQQTVVISKSFTFYGDPSKANLLVYVSYQFSLKVNGIPTTCQAVNSASTNFINCDITSFLITGYNTLVFTVTSQAVPGSTPQQNPAGLVYQLTITYPVKNLIVVSDTTNQVSGPDVTGTVNAVVTNSLGTPSLSGAYWIWDAATTSISTSQQTVVVTKTFTVSGFPLEGFLVVYVNDQFTLNVNGVATSCQATSSPTNPVNCDIANYLLFGSNTLVFNVIKNPNSGSTQQAAGLLYQLTLKYPVSFLIVVSDTTNQVSGPDVTGTVNAVVSTYELPSTIPGASWIWDATIVSAPTAQQTVLITKTFALNRSPLEASLLVYVDDSFTLNTNSQVTNCQATSVSANPVICDITNYLVSGTNTLLFTVTNKAYIGNTPQQNPAGLLYQLVVFYPAPVVSNPVSNSSVGVLFVVSDTTNQVSGPDVIGTANAVVSVYEGLPPISGTFWIWDASAVTNPAIQQTVTITKPFIINGTPSKGNLLVYVNDQFTLNVNNQTTNCQATSITPNPVSCDISTYLVPGSNILSFTVTNIGVSGSSAQLNPGGLDYKLTVIYAFFPIVTTVIVSDTSNQVSGPDVTGTTSAVLSTLEPTSPIPGAYWIWDAATVTNPAIQQTVIITKNFVIKGKISNGTLIVYVDGQFSLKTNCQITSCQATASGASPLTCDLSSLLINGNNHLEFTVNANSQLNHAGLLYKLTVISQQTFLS
jgi:hypothetical protein